ncbi:hypothetical protein ACIPSR_20215 [Pectobacterium sp. CHL-2024]|uniref:hypothetical protein n=1 Tax=Pectobacterium TaxID=122277 RepID=UPI001F0764A1|nr:hypothetical protein [Pectobacterium brasiliense]
MANLSENPQWVDGIYQIETSDPVVGGPDGVSNRQAKELASRTSYLKKEQEKTGSDLAKHTAAADPHTQYAPKENPSFTGTPKAPTPATDSNSQQIATTAFVRSVGSTKLAKDQHGADIPDKAAFYNNLQLRGSLGNGMTFARCDQAGDYVTTITDPNTVSDMPEFKGKKLYGYGVLHVSRRDNFVGQEYINHSGDYAWRQKWDDAVFTPWVVALSSSRVPTAADVGALPENATAQAAAKLATPRTINGVPFDGTANITLTPANLGLTETVDLAAGALAKSMNGSDIPDKTTFYNNVTLRGTLGDGMTFANCDKAGDYVVAINDPNTVSDMPLYKEQKLYGYGVLHVSQHDNFVGQEYINHSGDYAWRQKWDDRAYTPWVIALSSSRAPTAADLGALEKSKNGADILDSKQFAKNASLPYLGSGWVNFGGSEGTWTTSQFIDFLNGMGAFQHLYFVCSGSWSYAVNRKITDTGCGNIELSGAVVECFSDRYHCRTIRVTTATTSSDPDAVQGVFIYIDNGADSAPGWRREYNSKNFDVQQTCSAWVRFNENGEINDSYNVSAVVKNSTGDFTIKFKKRMKNGNYAFTYTVGGRGDSMNMCSGASQLPTAEALRVISVSAPGIGKGGDFRLLDFPINSVSIFGGI